MAGLSKPCDHDMRLEDTEMYVNGFRTANCQTTGYTAEKAEKTVPRSRFLEAVSEQIPQKERDYEEEAFESVGANAPGEVKQAWMEAAKEIGANGLGIGKNGMMTHISQMMIERVERGWNGGNPNDILGNSVQSALRAAKEALYDLDHPRAAGHTRSIEAQRGRAQERKFYLAFIARLERL